MKRVCALLLILALLSGSVPFLMAMAEPSLLLRIVYHPEEGEEQPYELPLPEERSGSWMWLQVPDDVPLEALEIYVEPPEIGRITLLEEFTPLMSEDGPLIRDFSASTEVPYPFVIQNMEDMTLVWYGWLTVSHEPCPEDLPETPPVAPEPTIEPTEEPIEEPTPEPTEGPTLEPTELPTPEPTAPPTPEPTPVPTEPPTPPPTLAPTEAPTLAPTPTPAATPSPSPTIAPTLVPTATPTLSPTALPTPVVPTFPPVPTPSPIPVSGYAVITGNSVNVRVEPLGDIIGKVGRDMVVYVSAQKPDAYGMVWHAASVLDKGYNGFIRSDLLRFMTQSEVDRYLYRPTPRPTLRPTLVPVPTSPPTPSPIPLSGYAVVTGNSVNVRVEPLGDIIGKVGRDTVVYVSVQKPDACGMVWHAVSVLDKGYNGFIRSDLLRFMTQSEVDRYLYRPTPRPTPVPTPIPTPVPSLGYSRVIWSGTPLKDGPVTSAATIQLLAVGRVVYVVGQVYDGLGQRWYAVQADGVYGYLLADNVVKMTTDEVDAYFKTLRPTPTPRPTVAPTLNPNISYVVLKENNVNFRSKPAGPMIRRVNRGTLAELLSGTPESADGHTWYYVRIGKETGYLRADMIDFVQIASTATPTPRPTAVPTPSPTPVPTPSVTPTAPPTPTPVPLPTPRPLTLLERLRMWADARTYLTYARNETDAASYAVRDFTGDGVAELVLLDVKKTSDGRNGLYLTTFRLADGKIEEIEGAAKQYAPVLTPNTALQVVTLKQEGRDILYIAQRNELTGKTEFGFGLLLQDGAWARVQLADGEKTPTPLLLVSADANGGLTIDDRSGLRPQAEPIDKDALTVFLNVLYQLVQGGQQGNG